MTRVLGYDKSPLAKNLLLDLRFEEGTGTVTRDWAKAHHVDPTLTGAPSWTTEGDLGVLDFTNPDSIVILAADAADLNFTTESFTILMWINTAYLDQQIFAKGNWGGPGSG